MTDEQDATTETTPADAPQAQDTPPKGKGGRPTIYTAELAARICEMVAGRVPVVEICDMHDMPSKDTLYRWKRENKEFSDQYAHAREDRADSRQDYIDEIVKKMIAKDIDPAVARVAIDAEKWQMGKEQPKRYSDKLQISGDADGDPIKQEITTIRRIIVDARSDKAGDP